MAAKKCGKYWSRFHFFAFVLALPLFLSGCGSFIPDCSAEETLDLVKDIFNNSFIDSVGVGARVEIYGIKTIGKSDGYQCSAIADFFFDDGSMLRNRSIRYNSTSSDDDHHLVEAWIE